MKVQGNPLPLSMLIWWLMIVYDEGRASNLEWFGLPPPRACYLRLSLTQLYGRSFWASVWSLSNWQPYTAAHQTYKIQIHLQVQHITLIFSDEMEMYVSEDSGLEHVWTCKRLKTDKRSWYWIEAKHIIGWPSNGEYWFWWSSPGQFRLTWVTLEFWGGHMVYSSCLGRINLMKWSLLMCMSR